MPSSRGGKLGTALACVLRQGGHRCDAVGSRWRSARRHRGATENSRYLPGLKLPAGLRVQADLNTAIAELPTDQPSLVVSVVPSHHARGAARHRRPAAVTGPGRNGQQGHRERVAKPNDRGHEADPAGRPCTAAWPCSRGRASPVRPPRVSRPPWCPPPRSEPPPRPCRPRSKWRLPRLHLRRRHRRRGRRRGQNVIALSCGMAEGWALAQHAGRPHHPWTGRDLARLTSSAGWQSADARRSGRHGRSRPDLQRPAEPQPHLRSALGSGQDAVPGARRDAPGCRGRKDHALGPRSIRPGRRRDADQSGHLSRALRRPTGAADHVRPARSPTASRAGLSTPGATTDCTRPVRPIHPKQSKPIFPLRAETAKVPNGKRRPPQNVLARHR